MMKIELPTSDNPVVILHADSNDILPRLRSGSVEAVITDPPFSERTHAGHDGVAPSRKTGDDGYDNANRKTLGYSAWTQADIDNFIPEMCRISSGWVVVMNDHWHHPAILAAMRACDRVTFPPLPFFSPGRSCRLSGDGPSSWTDWIMVSRTVKQYKWGTLPGGYVAEPGWRDRVHMGGKPVMLLRELVKHYSRPGDTVLDPFGGGGSTAEACLLEGRKCLIIEREEKFIRKIQDRIAPLLEMNALIPMRELAQNEFVDLGLHP
jgi:site-specific DNA-methyltransferase (adenine-specific)